MTLHRLRLMLLCAGALLAAGGCEASEQRARASEDADDSMSGSQVPAAGDGAVRTARVDAGAASPNMGPKGVPSDHDAGCATPSSAFDAISERIFEAHGCSAAACHGTQAAGGLTLSAPGAYRALVSVPAANSKLALVEPGRPEDSFLYLKLKAARDPSVKVAGSPMPVGSAPLSENELEAVRRWIAAGAPEQDSADNAASLDEIGSLLDTCRDSDAAVPSAPGNTVLAPPSADLGVQLQMPAHALAAGTEWEGCYASYYDLSDVVPKRYQSADGSTFYVNGTTIQQSAGSHHLVIMHSGLGVAMLGDASFGKWTCRDGDRAGMSCDPKIPEACGDDSVCGSEAKQVPACLGYGPFGSSINPASFGLGTALQAQIEVAPVTGVFRKVPIRGIIYWDLHAFNLSTEQHEQHAALNLLYTDDLREEEQHLSVSGNGYAGIAPFTMKDVCSTWEAPRNSRLIRLSSHTHRHGQRFWIKGPRGNQIYESFAYSDPAYIVLDPALSFDSPNAADRTLTFCATYNNGVKADGSLDNVLVTRKSRVPSYAFSSCEPTACAEGKVGASCWSLLGDAQCDSSPGAADGKCDACPTVSGETTEHEMFFMLPDIVLKPN